MFLLTSATYRTLVRYHPKIGHLYVPDLVARLPNENGGYFVRTNGVGFRSDLDFRTEPGARSRILVFGDSFTAADGCANEDRFAERMGELLDAEVYNFGLSGSAPDQHLLIFEEFGREIHADLIILAVSVHNIERIKLTHRPSVDLRTGRPVLIPKPYFELHGSDLRLRHVPVPRVRPELVEGEEGDYHDEGSVDPPLLQRLYFAPALKSLRERARGVLPQLRAHVRGFAYRSAGVQLYDDYFDLESDGWRLLSGVITRFNGLAGDVPVLLVPLPTYHYYVDRLDPAYQPVFDGLAESEDGLLSYALTSDLVAGKSLKERQRICFRDDPHYSEYGHREIARCIAAEVGRLGLLPLRKAEVQVPVRVEASNVSLRHVLAHVSVGEPAAALVREGEPLAAGLESWFVRDGEVDGFPHAATNHCMEEARIHHPGLVASVEVSCTDSHRPGARSGPVNGWSVASRSSQPARVRPSRGVTRGLRYDGSGFEVSQGVAQCAGAFLSSPFQTAAVLSLHENVDGTVASIAQGQFEVVEIVAEMRGVDGLGAIAGRVARLVGLSGQDAFTELDLLAEHYGEEDRRAVREALLRPTDDRSYEVPAFDEATVRSMFTLGTEPATSQRRIEIAGAFMAELRQLVARMVEHARAIVAPRELCVVGEPFLTASVWEEVRRVCEESEPYRHGLTGSIGAAMGAAQLVWRSSLEDRGGPHAQAPKGMGPGFSQTEIEAFLDTQDVPSHEIDARESRAAIEEALSNGGRVAYFQGRTVGPTPENARAILFRPQPEEARTGVTKFAGELRVLRPWHDNATRASNVADERIVWIPFRLPGEPLALTPFDAYRCMMLGGVETLLLGSYLIRRSEQPSWPGLSTQPPGSTLDERSDP